MEAHSIYSGENLSLGEEQRRPSWEGQEDRGEATQASLGQGGRGQSEPVPALHSALPATQEQGQAMGFAGDAAGGMRKRQQEDQSQKVSAAAGGAKAEARDISSVCKGGFSHRPVLTSNCSPPAALLKAGKVSIPTSVASRTFPGAGGRLEMSLPDGALLPPSPNSKSLAKGGSQAETSGCC